MTPLLAPMIAPSPIVTLSASPTCPARMTRSSMTTLPEMPHCATMMQWRPILTLCPICHQIVDLGAFADHGVAIGATIDSGPGANLHIVLNDNPAHLQDFAVTGCSHHIAESVLPDGAAGMHDHTIADQAIGDRGVGSDRALAADAHIGSNRSARVDHRAASDFGTRADYGPGIHGHAAFHARGRMD